MKPPNRVASRKTVIWNTKRKNGWQIYKDKTENNSKFNKASEYDGDDAEKVMKMIETEVTKVKFASFGKIKVYSKDRNLKKLEELQQEKMKTVNQDDNRAMEHLDSEIAVVLKKIERDKFEKDINYLERIKETKGRSTAEFGLRNKVLGRKQATPEQVVLIDPATGVEVNTPAEIKRVS